MSKKLSFALDWSAGLALPVVVPPIRSMLGFDIPEPVQPPPVRTLIENAKK